MTSSVGGPFVEDRSVYQLVDATLPMQAWDEAYFSLLSLKMHLQSLPSWSEMRVGAREQVDGTVEVLVTTGWTSVDAIGAWLDRGWTPDAVLRSLKPAPLAISVRILAEVI